MPEGLRQLYALRRNGSLTRGRLYAFTTLGVADFLVVNATGLALEPPALTTGKPEPASSPSQATTWRRAPSACNGLLWPAP